MATTSWNSTLSNTMFWLAAEPQPGSRTAFSSVTLPIRPFLNVTFVPSPVSNAAPLAVVAPLASMSRPSKVTLLALLSNWRTLLPATPRNVTILEPDRLCGP